MGLLAAVATALTWGLSTSAQEPDSGPLAPQQTLAQNTDRIGAVAVSWQPNASATRYRIGWVAFPDYEEAVDNDLPWLEAFVFVDVANRGQTSHTVSRLTPDTQYFFIVGSHGDAGTIAWSSWTQPLTTTAVPPAALCPPAGTATPEPGAEQPASTPAPAPAVVNGDYDADDDGLIEIRTLQQLYAMRYDYRGSGNPLLPRADKYDAAFPDAATNMGCLGPCIGYELMNDLDFDTNGNGRPDAGDDYWNDNSGWQPIGNDLPGLKNRYDAIFEGNGHVIANLYVYSSRNLGAAAGLFGEIDGAARIRNLRLDNPRVFGKTHGGGVGALVGTNHFGRISGVLVTGGRVETTRESAGSHAGGLVGINRGTIVASASSATVRGYANAGGLVGVLGMWGVLSGESPPARIIASYATGSVSAGLYAGGLVAPDTSGAITASYATGAVHSADNTAGGLAGHRKAQFIPVKSYWDTESSGIAEPAYRGEVGKTTAELQEPTDYTGIYSGWNRDLDGDRQKDDPWDFGTSEQYPVLKYNGMDTAAQR